MTFANLKEKIDALEKQLLAISSLNDICQQSIIHGSLSMNLESCAELLNHLIDPAMYQIEAVRMLVKDISDRSKILPLEEVVACS